MRQLDLFAALQPASESIDTEFKSARGGLPGSFCETYSAMANTQGGTIILGVVEKGTGLAWEGVPDAVQLRTVLWNQLNARQKVSRNLLTDADIQTLGDAGRSFVAVRVPRALRRDRPIYVGSNPLSGSFRRAEDRVTARVEGSVTNGRLQEVTGEHPKDITGVLQSLVRDGLLTQQNQRRWASDRVAGDSPQSLEDSLQLTGDSLQSAPRSPQLPEDSPQFSPELLALAEPARLRAKLPAAVMRDLIASLCTQRWLTSRELGTLLCRDADNLQTRFLTAMVREGRLALRFPDVPNRPDQAYQTVAASE